ncbi:MAG: BTAD domain-containing putative transcriptional regulator, partial [Vallitaleaceae bacterium]|nr:BTAD domain-containing putative transcriptional regulator [Vallitaleaceae bacterium]
MAEYKVTDIEDYSSHQYVIVTLGTFDVIKDSNSLIAQTSSAKKIWELYKFMLSFREKAFTPEALLDHLWVSENYTDPKSTLRMQMHRLRQVLEEDQVSEEQRTLLYINGYYRWNPQLDIRLDVDVFEDRLNQGDHLVEANPDEALANYLKALDLYTGDYLPECVGHYWVLPIRNQYRRLFLKAMYSAINLLKLKEDYDEIIKLCHRAILIDIYEEMFHINLMEAMYMNGEQRQALNHYAHITAFYDKEMSVKPSPQMKLMHKKLLLSKDEVFSEDTLNDILEPELFIENAFFCEAEAFKAIYKLERRRSERTGADFSIGVLTVANNKDDTHSQIVLRANHLKRHLMEHLRKGDTLTRWNEHQFLVLLPEVKKSSMEEVLRRVLTAN